ncbi:MAG: hypothetical protein EWV92_00245 [Microcystis aeruginosa Ma_MB_S_20031200_S102]|uniref:Uncharacterized protein n=1 Tax=Microcystis aeruginosa Ma_MB_S_20031200_S102 TaxID=2486254 RepID=A0A552F9K9_MICAE|nr:MAG: hypothetical protein EWV79_16415 [Microcystis aeruginosa Ma_MB_S_20031200_S102D]TRU43392.1 MAG: hypothetical protein EWV92_00245 [Microcystis aeruginosa Ma_MB_S_20031200_S102]
MLVGLGFGRELSRTESGFRIQESGVRSQESGELRMSINQLNALFRDFRQFYVYFSHFCPLKN